MAIQFYMHEVRFKLKQQKLLKATVKKIFENENYMLKNLAYVFCSDEYLLTINQQYLQHDSYTDIITFDLSEKKGKVYGEIYISIERVQENATLYRVDFEMELHRVVFHGALHLCGYKDKTAAEKKAMRQKEEYYLKTFEKQSNN
jgi:probable rRNA maturation factor